MARLTLDVSKNEITATFERMNCDWHSRRMLQARGQTQKRGAGFEGRSFVRRDGHQWLTGGTGSGDTHLAGLGGHSETSDPSAQSAGRGRLRKRNLKHGGEVPPYESRSSTRLSVLKSHVFRVSVPRMLFEKIWQPFRPIDACLLARLSKTLVFESQCHLKIFSVL